jgi:DNA-binding HxlR family transcriptional regulator
MGLRAQGREGAVRVTDHSAAAAEQAAPGPESSGAAVLDWRDVDLENGSLKRAAEIVGDKWVMLIVRDAMLGITRFDDIQHRLGLSAPVLSARIRRLVDEGVLEPRPYRDPGQRTRTEYCLTRKGAELFHALVALMQWGDRYLADPAGPALCLRHDACGGPIRIIACCADENVEVHAGEARIEPGPGATFVDSPRRRPFITDDSALL